MRSFSVLTEYLWIGRFSQPILLTSVIEGYFTPIFKTLRRLLQKSSAKEAYSGQSFQWLSGYCAPASWGNDGRDVLETRILIVTAGWSCSVICGAQTFAAALTQVFLLSRKPAQEQEHLVPEAETHGQGPRDRRMSVEKLLFSSVYFCMCLKFSVQSFIFKCYLHN